MLFYYIAQKFSFFLHYIYLICCFFRFFLTIRQECTILNLYYKFYINKFDKSLSPIDIVFRRDFSHEFFFSSLSRNTKLTLITCGCFLVLTLLILTFLMICPIHMSSSANGTTDALIVTETTTSTTTTTTTTTETVSDVYDSSSADASSSANASSNSYNSYNSYSSSSNNSYYSSSSSSSSSSDSIVATEAAQTDSAAANTPSADEGNDNNGEQYDVASDNTQ